MAGFLAHRQRISRCCRIATLRRVLLRIDETGLHNGYMAEIQAQKKKGCIAATLGITGGDGQN